MEWNDALSTLIATVVSTIVSSGVAYLVSRHEAKDQKRQFIDELVIKVIEVSMEYPFVEDEEFCKKWPHVEGDKEKRTRYEIYCCLLFNLMEHIWEHTNGDREMTRDILHVEEIIHQHKSFWQSDKANCKGYQIGFRNFVDAIIEKGG